jgi:hypothetical protein
MEDDYIKNVDDFIFEKSEHDNEETFKIKEDLKKVNDYFKTQL